MRKSSKQIILKEIKSWRTNRLLPAEYCDFLSNLYAEGDIFRSDERNAEKRRIWWKFSVPPIPWRRLLVSLTGSALLLVFVLHFTSFPNWMQIGILLLCTIVFYGLAFFARMPVSLLRVVFLTAACLLVAVDGVYLAQILGLDDSLGWSLGVLLLVLLVWILSGVAGESRMIVGAAWLGIGVLYGAGIRYIRGVEWFQYWWNTVYWLIFAGVSVALGVFLGRNRLFVAPVWAVSGVFAFLVPDALYLLSGAKPDFLVDATAFLKMSLIVTWVIVFRDPIQNWLDSFVESKYNRIE